MALAGHVALVTAGAKGLGCGVAEALALVDPPEQATTGQVVDGASKSLI